MKTVTYNGEIVDIDAARALMDDDICDSIHGSVDTEQEFIDAYAAAHIKKYGEEFIFA